MTNIPQFFKVKIKFNVQKKKKKKKKKKQVNDIVFYVLFYIGITAHINYN